MMKRDALRPSLLLASALGLSLTATVGCSSFNRYEIPTTICGRKIDPTALQPLLPSGENFEARPQISDDKQSSCLIVVDKSAAFTISEIRNQNKFDVMEFARKYPRRSSQNPKKSEIGADAVTSDRWLMSINACTGHGRGDYYILDLDILDEGQSKPKELERFAQSYLPDAMKAMGCTE
ncbi:hypothetical protein G3I20_32060 [Streptomyces sp. SID8111]|uniref:hypothetical protein n=1 Tax=Streptomyces sp. SID8111 TaxID=2706100 RepID=UPI0013BF6001|nr:hypothetical protein [Streptomyces sp. SID8111]NEC31108.1 hypothetical protein [Streptomyces sp. SID8111]